MFTYAAAVFYIILTLVYITLQAYSKSLAYQKLLSRSERAIWKRDFAYCLNWIYLPLILIPLIGSLAYFICFDELLTSEIIMYLFFFIFFGIFVMKGIDNFLFLKEKIENLKEKPALVKKSRTENSDGQVEIKKH